MISRSFIRKRAISLAATGLVAATALALAQGPMRGYHVRGAIPVQYVTDRTGDFGETPFLAENDSAMSKMMADMAVAPWRSPLWRGAFKRRRERGLAQALPPQRNGIMGGRPPLATWRPI